MKINENSEKPTVLFLDFPNQVHDGSDFWSHFVSVHRQLLILAVKSIVVETSNTSPIVPNKYSIRIDHRDNVPQDIGLPLHNFLNKSMDHPRSHRLSWVLSSDS